MVAIGEGTGGGCGRGMTVGDREGMAIPRVGETFFCEVGA